MTRFWTISIVIPGECFAMKDRAHETIQTRKEWVRPALKKIDVEEVTSDLSPFGDDEGDET
jgi:hypothetical protein